MFLFSSIKNRRQILYFIPLILIKLSFSIVVKFTTEIYILPQSLPGDHHTLREPMSFNIYEELQYIILREKYDKQIKIMFVFFLIFLWPMPLFLLSAHKQCILSHFIHNSTPMFP
jgi:hypothetical protein